MPRLLTRLLTALRRPIERREASRVVVGLWLAVHTVVVAGAPVVDGLAPHADRVVAHWEDSQDRSCPAQHDPDCQLCQVIQTPLAADAAEPQAVVPAPRVSGVLPCDAGLAVHDAARNGVPDPRGPPQQ